MVAQWLPDDAHYTRERKGRQSVTRKSFVVAVLLFGVVITFLVVAYLTAANLGLVPVQPALGYMILALGVLSQLAIAKEWIVWLHNLVVPRNERAPLLSHQLTERFTRQWNFRVANISGDGKKHDPRLFVERNHSKDILRDFLASDKRCLAILGESGVGKTNMMLGLKPELPRNYVCAFYESAALNAGVSNAFKQDFPWAFRETISLAEGARNLCQIADEHGKEVIVFIDALEASSRDSDQGIPEDLRRLMDEGARLVISCKENAWARFARESAGGLSAFGDRVFPTAPLAGLPGYVLSRLSEDEFDRAWNRHAEIYRLPGDPNAGLRKEFALPLMMRLAAQTYGGGPLPVTTSDQGLFRAHWKHHSELTGDALAANTVVREIANEMLKTSLQAIHEADLWPDGVSESKRPILEALLRDNVLVLDESGPHKKLRFFHEKFQSFAVSILHGRWDERCERDPFALAAELTGLWQANQQNQVLANALEMFVVSVEKGLSPLLTSILNEDLIAYLELVLPIGSPDLEDLLQNRQANQPVDRDWFDTNRSTIEGWTNRAAESLDLLLNKHFPALYFPETDSLSAPRRAGVYMQLTRKGYIWGVYPADKGPMSKVDFVDDDVYDKDAFNRLRIKTRSSSSPTSSFLDRPPHSRVFRLVAKPLREAFERLDYHDILEVGQRFMQADMQVPALVNEETWHIIDSVRVDCPRRGGHSFGIGQCLGFKDSIEIEEAPIADILERIRVAMHWDQMREDNKVVLKDELRGGLRRQTLQYLPTDDVDRLVGAQGGATDFSVDDYTVRGEYAAALRRLHMLLETLPDTRDVLPQIVPRSLLRGPVRSEIPERVLIEYFERLLPIAVDACRELARLVFPTVYHRFSLFTFQSVDISVIVEPPVGFSFGSLGVDLSIEGTDDKGERFAEVEVSIDRNQQAIDDWSERTIYAVSQTFGLRYPFRNLVYSLLENEFRRLTDSWRWGRHF